mmetsp:Transcript_14204/g.24146  ORF Transcript_14204/g.24146 Transcript_14204/m.24146 type:complete len:200 (-) Transcript_14204:21-620(-)
MVGSEGPEHFVSLDAELSRRHEDEGAQAVHGSPPLPVQFLDHWHQVRECFSGAGPRADNHVPPSQRVGNGGPLRLRHLGELGLGEPADGRLGYGQVGEPDLNLLLLEGLNHFPSVAYALLLLLEQFDRLLLLLLLLLLRHIRILVVQDAGGRRLLLDPRGQGSDLLDKPLPLGRPLFAVRLLEPTLGPGLVRCLAVPRF